MPCTDGRLPSLSALSEPGKPNILEAVSLQRKADLRIAMTAGNIEMTERTVAARLGVSKVHVEVAPADNHGDRCRR